MQMNQANVEQVLPVEATPKLQYPLPTSSSSAGCPTVHLYVYIFKLRLPLTIFAESHPAGQELVPLASNRCNI